MTQFHKEVCTCYNACKNLHNDPSDESLINEPTSGYQKVRRLMQCNQY